MRHPLEPLSARKASSPSACSETPARSRRPRASSRSASRSRPRSSSTPAPARSRPPRGVRRPVRQRHQLLLRGDALAHRQASCSSWKHVPGVQPTMTIDEQVECEQAVLASPEFKAALKKHYGIDDTQPGHGRYLERRQLRRRGGPHAPAGPAALLPPHRPDRQRLRPADRGPAAGRRSQHDGGDPRRGVRPLAAAAAASATTPPTASPNFRDGHQAAGDHAAARGRASRSTATRCAGRTGASSSASTPARG